MNKIPTILEDNRKIKSIIFQDNTQYTIGSMGVTEIKAYGEPSEFCLVAWVAVFKGKGRITNRIPAYQVMVSYE